jgi:hypothetical protein
LLVYILKHGVKKQHQSGRQSEAAILRSAYSGFCWIPPVVRRLFEVNSEPHTGARPSVRLCVGLMKKRPSATFEHAWHVHFSTAMAISISINANSKKKKMKPKTGAQRLKIPKLP